ncbi:MAG TPA: MBL fold metallo-hydrolase [Dehalococcoidia bacterium]|nr:MBL fold metallo-hydrolase [Dehalococcoidia bacterium]
MKTHRHKPIKVTEHFYQLGTVSFPVYLSLGQNGMIIEGGTGATSAIIVDQIRQLGIDPQRIKYVVLTHTHTDHIGAIPHLQKLWPHLKVAASPLALKLLAHERTVRDFLANDRAISEIMLSKGEIQSPPPQLEQYVFHVDQVLEEGDQIDLGDDIIWTVHDTPGHSSCHISLFEEKEHTLMVGDATGFYVPEKGVFWPNYFESLEAYCKSIRKLTSLPASRGALCHNGVVEGQLKDYFSRALISTLAYHREMMQRLSDGEDAAEIAMEKARWVNTLTDIQTLEVMRRLARVLISRSQHEAEREAITVPRLIK